MAEYEQDKAQRLAAVRSQKQFAELAECTFAPALHHRPRRHGSAAGEPPPVKGMAGFLERKKQAQQRVEEEAARAAQVFKTNPQGPKARCTQAQPFQLSSDRKVCAASVRRFANAARVCAGHPWRLRLLARVRRLKLHCWKQMAQTSDSLGGAESDRGKVCTCISRR